MPQPGRRRPFDKTRPFAHRAASSGSLEYELMSETRGFMESRGRDRGPLRAVEFFRVDERAWLGTVRSRRRLKEGRAPTLGAFGARFPLCNVCHPAGLDVAVKVIYPTWNGQALRSEGRFAKSECLAAQRPLVRARLFGKAM
jgi:hypothetical protein